MVTRKNNRVMATCLFREAEPFCNNCSSGYKSGVDKVLRQTELLLILKLRSLLYKKSKPVVLNFKNHAGIGFESERVSTEFKFTYVSITS